METPRLTIPHLHAAVLAGGSGTRFWPLSRELEPKQFLDIFGGVSLLAQAFHRISPMIEAGALWVVTGERLLEELRAHLESQPTLRGTTVRYLVEPLARNTGPAIAFAAAAIAREDPEAILAILPADHLLDDGETWGAAVRTAVALAEEGRLVTIGLTPSRPETGYGYIRAGELLATGGNGVACFAEKPDLVTAEAFLRDGGYLWNSGILVARADRVLDELRAVGTRARTPESAEGVRIADVAELVASLPEDERLSEETRAAFGGLPSVPFDKAVLEVSDRVAVVPTTLRWSDVGSLLSIEELAAPDSSGNALVGRVVAVDTHDTVAYSADRLVALLGISDALVVDTADATLVASKDRAQDVRLVVEALQAIGAQELVAPRTSVRPWGGWTQLLEGERFRIRTLSVRPCSALSLHRHAHRAEHWIVVAGTASVRIGEDASEVHPNESVYIPIGAPHRLENCGLVPLTIVEVAVGEYLGEDDISRLE